MNTFSNNGNFGANKVDDYYIDTIVHPRRDNIVWNLPCNMQLNADAGKSSKFSF
ncbi:unnamed protein product [Moneuplotes crassus]|uniref:Uncharacterized protein n=1 Tax=Euplotes crassus TaxID=5936 RepID=A0AAD1Y154_EUPCR|nr:unnamed protein product [Moneuplotes crassus]